MKIILQKFIHRKDLQCNRDIIYLFGDNDMRQGLGGQAKEMRGQANAIGIRTKKAPRYGNVYYLDEEYDENISKIRQDFNKVDAKLQQGSMVVIPSDGFGTGLAKLKKYAPETLKYINDKIKELERKYNHE